MSPESVSTAPKCVSVRPVPQFLRRSRVSELVDTSLPDTRNADPRDVQTAIDLLLSSEERLRLAITLGGFRSAVEGREPVSSKTAQIALALIDQTVLAQTARQTPWLPPHVSRSPNGEVVLEWWHGSRKLTVYVGEHVREFVRVWGPDIHSEMADGAVDGGYDLAQHLRWLRAGL